MIVRAGNTGSDQMANASYFEIVEQSGRGFAFRLRSKTSIILITSEPYADEASAAAAIGEVRRLCASDASYVRHPLDDGRWTFTLETAEGLVRARGQAFASRDMMDATIKLTQITAPATDPTPTNPFARRARPDFVLGHRMMSGKPGWAVG